MKRGKPDMVQGTTTQVEPSGLPGLRKWGLISREAKLVEFTDQSGGEGTYNCTEKDLQRSAGSLPLHLRISIDQHMHVKKLPEVEKEPH